MNTLELFGTKLDTIKIDEYLELNREDFNSFMDNSILHIAISHKPGYFLIGFTEDMLLYFNGSGSKKELIEISKKLKFISGIHKINYKDIFTYNNNDYYEIVKLQLYEVMAKNYIGNEESFGFYIV